MVLIGLLLVAAVLVVLGIVFSSVGLIVASLVASALAAGVMIWSYLQNRSSTKTAGGKRRAGRRSADDPSGPPSTAADPKADQVAASGSGAASAPPTEQDAPAAVPASAPTVSFAKVDEDPATASVPGGTDAEGQVWVADGHPEFHREKCSALDGLAAESIPLSQAQEDGFTPCSVCTPLEAAATQSTVDDAAGSSVPAAPATSEAADSEAVRPESDDATQGAEPGAADGVVEVWVADGYPEYHVAGCSELGGLNSEPIPYDQAVDDGFQPCVVCNPDRVTAGAVPTAPAAPGGAGTVWVVDGRPDYHRQDCRTLQGSDAEPIPREQAVEDGFAACTECAPDSGDAPDAPPVQRPDSDQQAFEPQSATATDDRSVWVVDGFPNYHRENCSEIADLDSEPVPHDQAVGDGFAECSVCTPEASEAPAGTTKPSEAGSEPKAGSDSEPSTAADGSGDVWVVDGFPDYHRRECVELVGLDAEPVPHDQAVEDGFRECTVCRPEAAEAPAGHPEPAAVADQSRAAEDTPAQDTPAEHTPAATTEQTAAEVWVVDGFPDYHRQQCAEIAGLDSEPVPHDQAVEDGFTECSVCRPEAAEAPERQPEPDAGADAGAPAEPHVEDATAETVAEVWVVDGFPDYHRQQCPEIAGLNSEPVPHDQAVEDGFTECRVCTPEAAGASDAQTPSDPEPATAPEPEQPAEPEPQQATASEPEQEAQPEQPAEPEPVQAAEPERAAEAEPVQAAEPERTAEPEPVQAAEPERAAEAEPVQTAEPERTAEPEPVQAAEPERTTEPEPEPQQAAEPEPVQAAASEPEPSVEPEPERQPEPSVQPEPERQPEPSVQPEPALVGATAASGASSSTAPAGADAPMVWVVDGRPRFHAEDCLIIKGQQAQPMLLSEAETDGFQPCSLCQRRPF
ncbi:hypothetical protein [uncultured Jatrophihabitans sp.]|uniref:hypothetical protein n=1 Tax=uncultured Jatrophihabitans sp. TaxID=1610747 RepID=UPI0035CA1E84